MKSGEIDKIYAKWFMNPVPPGNHMNFAMTPPIREAFKNPNDKACSKPADDASKPDGADRQSGFFYAGQDA